MILQNFVLHQDQGALTMIPCAFRSYDLNTRAELPNVKLIQWHKNSSLCTYPTASPMHKVNTRASTHCMVSPCHLMKSRMRISAAHYPDNSWLVWP